MRKIILSLVLLGFANVAMATTWVCYRYIDNKPTGGFIKVQADSKYEAEKKALKKYRKDLGYKADYVKCKYELFP